MSQQRTDMHDLPLPNRLVSDAIKEWMDTRFGLATAANPEDKDILEQIRYLHLDNYWYTLVPKILDELRRAGIVTS
jgi:hypothetical protein